MDNTLILLSGSVSSSVSSILTPPEEIGMKIFQIASRIDSFSCFLFLNEIFE